MASENSHIGTPETRTTQPIFPWYKEKLQTKCLRGRKNKHHLAGALDSRRWRFFNTGLDDFRDGYPPSDREEPHSVAQNDTSPAIFGMKNAASERGPKKRFSKEQACYSKPIILQQVHREHVVAVEQKLKQHPLALFPHLEQGMPPELFGEVISVLDPDMCVSRPSTVSSPERQQCVEEANAEDVSELCETNEEEVIDSKQIKPMSKNPYKGLQVRDSSAEEQDQTVSVKRLRSPSQDEDIKKVTKLFCDWVTSLGGETNNLSESTILGLFVSGFEKKPSLTFPIQVVEPSLVPEELRNSVEDLRKDYTQHALLKDSEPYKSKRGTKKPCYGVWYLDPKGWKKRDPDEPLRDPKTIPEDLEFLKEIGEKDEELRQIHATQAFKQFIISKGLRVPRFLSSLFDDEEQEHRTRGGSDGIGSGSTRKGTVVL